MAPIESWGTISDTKWNDISKSNPARGVRGPGKLGDDEITQSAVRAVGFGLRGIASEFKFTGGDRGKEAQQFGKKVRILSDGDMRVIKKRDTESKTTIVFVGPKDES